MIQEYVDRFISKREELRKGLIGKEPFSSYFDLVQFVIMAISEEDPYRGIDPDHIHEIDDGGYAGTLVYVIPEKDVHPDNYWYVKVSYGSCSGCDTLQGIYGYGDDTDESQADQIMSLCLHVVQGLHSMSPSYVA